MLKEPNSSRIPKDKHVYHDKKNSRSYYKLPLCVLIYIYFLYVCGVWTPSVSLKLRKC